VSIQTASSELALPFTREEFQHRLTALRRKMAERNIDIVLLDELEHLAYITGYAPRGTRYQVCVVPLEQEPIMLVRSVDEVTFREQSWLSTCVPMGDAEDEVAVLRRTLLSLGWAASRIGVELDSHFLPVKRYDEIRATLAEATFVDFSGLLWELRLRKSPQELAYLRQAGTISDAAMLCAIEACGEGRNESDAVIAAYSEAFRLGADNSWVIVVTSGRRTTSVHGALAHRCLAAGDIVHLESIPQVNGYTARMMRPTSIGQPADRVRDAALKLIEIQDQQFAALRPGVRASDIDRIAREQVLRAGLRTRYDNITGYTVGYIPGIATPRTSDFTRVFLPTSDWILEESMAFHMYVQGEGIGISESVVITETGCERVTNLERKLFVRD
jgi:Xaa-Pro dipeptidase